jgi:hypothetical protein
VNPALVAGHRRQRNNQKHRRCQDQDARPGSNVLPTQDQPSSKNSTARHDAKKQAPDEEVGRRNSKPLDEVPSDHKGAQNHTRPVRIHGHSRIKRVRPRAIMLAPHGLRRWGHRSKC